MVKKEFLILPPLFILISVRPAVLQNMIGSACNSQIPQANLHAALDFVHAKNCSQ
jgi:hypothetical protein